MPPTSDRASTSRVPPARDGDGEDGVIGPRVDRRVRHCGRRAARPEPGTDRPIDGSQTGRAVDRGERAGHGVGARLWCVVEQEQFPGCRPEQHHSRLAVAAPGRHRGLVAGRPDFIVPVRQLDHRSGRESLPSSSWSGRVVEVGMPVGAGVGARSRVSARLGVPPLRMPTMPMARRATATTPVTNGQRRRRTCSGMVVARNRSSAASSPSATGSGSGETRGGAPATSAGSDAAGARSARPRRTTRRSVGTPGREPGRGPRW